MRAHVWPMVGGLAVLCAARRYYRNWGATKGECRMRLAGDDLIARPAVQTTDAVSIDRCAAEVWPWLVQMAQDRSDLRQGQELASGDVIRMAPRGWLGLGEGAALTVAEIVPGRAIVLRARPPQLPWTMAWSFHLLPRGVDQCRLLVRTHVALRYPGEVLVTEAAGPFIALMIRGVLLNIQRRADETGPTGSRPVDEKRPSPDPVTTSP